ncbi:metallophosphoesterase [Herbidospora sp. NEAU-GS84]|uniref:Metallophosphoesterase n=1 Tax=Herbidospora solisilvae TaxID=2696284 RepID=A0A7C9J9L4_9ACTN|nr:metallophosphoesterase [Herbidospora solisilvae]NAS20524.1 metallophosphoesterase [Herbidospora solisilvae]
MTFLLAISDVHVGYPENREIVERIRPRSETDWLLLPGDVSEKVADFEWVLGTLASRFARVVWAPGNHDLWTHPSETLQLRGVERYDHLVKVARDLGVVTPEDPYPTWEGPDGPVTVAPLMVLYDYSYRVPGVTTKEAALKLAYDKGVVCTDEMVLHPDPYDGIDEWCAARAEETERRLAERPGRLPTVLVNHYPLVRDPTFVLRHPEFAIWCGTDRTADWHIRFGAVAMVYGHLHIPRTTWHDGVRFEEVSLGYPREWRPRSTTPGELRQILPVI